MFACVSVSGREGKGEGGQPAVLWQSCPQQVRRWFLIDCGLKLCNNDHVCSAATAAAHGKFLSMILSLHFKFFSAAAKSRDGSVEKKETEKERKVINAKTFFLSFSSSALISST